MTNREAIEILRDTPIDIRSSREDNIHTLYAKAQNVALDALEETEWIPFIFDKDGYFCCKTPYENDEILVSSLDKVWQDTWICTCDAYGNCIEGLESNTELDGLAWKPMPKPWGGVEK